MPPARKIKKKAPAKQKVHHHLPAGRVQKARHPLLSLAILLGGTFLLVSGLWMVSSSGVIANRFKPQLEVELSKALSREVTVGRLEGGLFDRVVLRDVSISTRTTAPESLDITIQRVVVQYSLWDILVRKRPLAESLHSIQLIRPLIIFERSPDGIWRSPKLALRLQPSLVAGPATPAPKLPPIKISLHDAEIRLTDGSHSTSIKKLKGLLNLKDSSAGRLYLAGRTESHRRNNLKISGIIDLPAGSFRIRLKASRVDLQPLEQVVHLSDFINIQQGQADLELKFTSRAPSSQDLISGVGVKGKLVMYDLTLQTRLLNEPLKNIFGVAHLADRNMTLKNMQAILGKTTWSARGKIQDIQTPRLNIHVQSDELELADLVGTFPSLAQLNTSGSGKAAILIKGKAPDLTVTANFYMPKGKIGRLRIRRFEVITRYRSRELRLLLARGIFARGWIEGRGRILFPENENEPAILNFRGDAMDLALQDIADLLGVKSVKGRFGGMLLLTGPVKQPTLHAEVNSDQIKVSGSTFQQVKGNLEYNHESLRLNLDADWGPLKNVHLGLKTKKYPDGWHLEKFQIIRDKQKLLQASGQWGGPTKDVLRGKISAQGLPIQTIPLLPVALKHLNGTINFTGELKGTSKAPYLLGHFDTKCLMTFPKGKLDAKGEIEVTRNNIQLKKIWLDRKRFGLNGQIGFGKKAFLQGEVNLSRMPLQHLAALGGMVPEEVIQGTVHGRVSVSGSTKKLKCDGEIFLAQLKWKQLQADSGILNFTTLGKRVWIKEMELVQPGGKLNAVFETELGKSSGLFQILAWMKNFSLGERKWTGDLKVKGSYQDSGSCPKYIARLQLDNFKVDQHVLPAADGELVFSQNKINLAYLHFGKNISLTGKYILPPEKKGNLQIRLDNSDLKPIRILLAPKQGELNEHLSGILNVMLEDDAIAGKLRLTTGENTLNAEATVQLTGKGALSDYQGRLQMRNFKTSTLFDLFLLAAPPHAPRGTLSGRVVFEGKTEKPEKIDGDLIFSDFVFGLWNFKTLKAVWETSGEQWNLKTLEGLQARGSLCSEGGAMRENPDGTMDLSLNLVADNFSFFSRLYHGHFGVNGKLAVAPFDLQLAVVSPDFKLNLYPFNDFRAALRYQGENLMIRTPADYPYQIVGDFWLPPGGDVIFRRLTVSDKDQEYVSVQGRVDGRGTSDLLIKVRDVPAKVIARSLGWPQPWSGLANGSFRYTNPNEITRFDIMVKIDNGSVLHLPFDTFYGKIVVDHDWLYFQGPEGTCVLKKHGKYTMRLSGKLPLPQCDEAAEALKGAEMDIRVVMPEGDFSYITFVPYIAKASGKSMLDLNIKGTMDYPTMYGRAWVENGTLEPRLYTPKIENLKAAVTFEENKMFVSKMEGKIGQGRLQVVSGPAGDWVTIFRRLQPHQLNLKLDSLDGPIRLDTTADYEFVAADVRMDALLTGTLEAPILGGSLELSDGQFTFPARLHTDWAENLQASDMTYDQLKLVSRKNVWYYNDMVRAQIKPDQFAMLDGGKHSFSGEGRIVIAKGSFTYLETDFNLDPNEETVVICPGREKPQLQALAKTVIRNVEIKDEGRKRDATIYLRVYGTIGALNVKLESDPDMTQAQMVSLLTLGEDFSSWSQEEVDRKIQSAGARVLGRLAGNLIGREIEKSIKKITPLDVIDIRLGGVEKLADNIVSGANNTGTAESDTGSNITGSSLLQDTQIDVGKYLTDDLFLNYRGILKDVGEEKGGLAWQSYFGLEYNLDSSKKIKIYKNFDVDSDQELFWGIEGRMQFEGWNPEIEKQPETAAPPRQLMPTLTPVLNEKIMN